MSNHIYKSKDKTHCAGLRRFSHHNSVIEYFL